jgi:acyl-CoA thioesterase I
VPNLRNAHGLLIGLTAAVASVSCGSANPASPSPTTVVKIMPLGDSITQGDAQHASYRRTLWRLLQEGGFRTDFVGSQREGFGGGPPNPDFDQDHEGHWGFRVDEILVGLDGWAGAAQPDVVLVHLGTNDVLQGQSVPGTTAELESVIRRLQAVNSRVTVLVAQVIPSAAAPANSIEILNAAIRGMAARTSTAQSLVIAVDHASGFDPSVDTYDGIHPNERGEQKMAEAWFRGLRGIL